MTTNPIVFIHGLLLSGWVFTRMEKYFECRGRRCFCFNYSSRSCSVAEAAALLHQWLTEKKINSADLICHSLGGLVSHRFFAEYGDCLQPESSVVCLGTPFRGSKVANTLAASSLGLRVLGVHQGAELQRGIDRWPCKIKLGVIAGNRHIGVGRLLGLQKDQPGDGTVLVEETGVKGLTDHIILPVSHSQMTFSHLVADQAEHFLTNGGFIHVEND